LYLNKTCFNGLFRVNSQGYFNVPYGSYTNPTIADPQIIKAVSHFLQTESVTISLGDFEAAVATATSEDFIYFDPPYQPISQTSAFTAYSRQGFGETEQIRLKQLCDRLSDRGCQVLVSNSDAPLIQDLYGDRRYQIKTVGASRAINAIGSKRGKVQELLIYNRYQTRKVIG
jgi:DNA adenine methylase